MNHRTTALVLATFVLSIVNLSACPTCTPRTGSGVETFIHGAVPQGPLDYVIAAAMVVVVLVTVIATVRAIAKREQTL